MDDHTPSEDEHIYLSWWRPEKQNWQSLLASANAHKLSSADVFLESLKCDPQNFRLAQTAILDKNISMVMRANAWNTGP